MLELELKDFDIKQIADSGQCFRIYRLDDDTWEVHALNEVLEIQKKENLHFFSCSREIFQNFWSNYFDLQTDYEFIKQRILKTKDEYLANAVRYGSGLRILRQDPWEMIVSFIISQQNNIPRIKKCLKNLCDINNGRFPYPFDFLKFSKKDLASVKLGYRENYLLKISESVENGDLDLSYLMKMSYLDAIKYLKSFRGIGEKVANCIALFGLHKTEAFPIDVWIKKIIQNRYNNEFSLENFHLQDIGGIIQQYMYFYERSLQNRN